MITKDGYAYWGNHNGGTVMRAPLTGGEPQIIATGTGPLFVAVDGTNLYFTDLEGGAVVQVPREGGTLKTLASGQGGPTGLAIDAAYVYWANKDDGKIQRVPIGGGTIEPIASGEVGTMYVRVDAANIYWANSDIEMKSLVGGNVITLAADETPVGLAIDSSYVYWVTGSSGNVRKVPIAGGMPTTIATGQTDFAQSVFVDATSVYWGRNTGFVMKMPLAGGDPIALASGNNNPNGLTVDDGFVYWVETVHAGARIRRFPKNPCSIPIECVAGPSDAGNALIDASK